MKNRAYNMTASNIRKYAKAGLDYLVKDYQNTVSDVKSIEKYARKAAIPVVLTGLGFVSGIVGCGGGGGSSGSSYAGAITAPADRIDYVNTNYVKADVSTPVNAKAIFTGESEPIMNAVFKKVGGTETAILMRVDTDVITSTLKDGIWTNGEAVTTEDYVLPIGAYDFKINASRGGATASTGWCSRLNILPDNAYNAWETRRGPAQIYLNSAGMSATAVAPAVGESDEFLSWIANASNSDIVANEVKRNLYLSDSNGAIINGGTPINPAPTREQYALLLNSKFKSLINKNINDDEVPARSYGSTLDKFNSGFVIYGNSKNEVWASLDGNTINIIEKAHDISTPGTYLKNIENGYVTFDGQGYQITPVIP